MSKNGTHSFVQYNVFQFPQCTQTKTKTLNSMHTIKYWKSRQNMLEIL